MPLHLQEMMKGNCRHGKNPVVARLTKEILSIPVHPAVTEEDAKRIAWLVKAFVKGK